MSARQSLVTAEQTVIEALAQARAVIVAQDEELRQARAAAAERTDDALTEEQVAKIVQASQQKVAEMRKAGLITPSFYVASMPRYWRSKLPEIFEGTNLRKPRRRKP